jgi:hypothetical protein
VISTFFFETNQKRGFVRRGSEEAAYFEIKQSCWGWEGLGTDSA